MKPRDMRVVLTGATGGIGRELARTLVADGAEILLIARNQARLVELCNELGDKASFVAADLATDEGLDRVENAARNLAGVGANVLINNAGTNPFGPFLTEDSRAIEHTISTNVLAPMLLTRRLVPLLQRQDAAIVLNVGSILGSIGLPGQVSYSASKFALHGFSEALRRELRNSTIRVLYTAPRATDTSMLTPAMRRLNEQTGVRTDAPSAVAEVLVRQLAGRRAERFIGWPERLFVKLNALFPSLVDSGSRKSARIIAGTPTDSTSMTATNGVNP